MIFVTYLFLSSLKLFNKIEFSGKSIRLFQYCLQTYYSRFDNLKNVYKIYYLLIIVKLKTIISFKLGVLLLHLVFFRSTPGLFEFTANSTSVMGVKWTRSAVNLLQVFSFSQNFFLVWLRFSVCLLRVRWNLLRIFLHFSSPGLLGLFKVYSNFSSGFPPFYFRSSSARI